MNPSTPTQVPTTIRPAAFVGAAVLVVCAGFVELGGTVCVLLGTTVLVTILSDCVVVTVAVPPTTTPPEVTGVTIAVEKVERTGAADAEVEAMAPVAKEEAPAPAVDAADWADERAGAAAEEALESALEGWV